MRYDFSVGFLKGLFGGSAPVDSTRLGSEGDAIRQMLFPLQSLEEHVHAKDQRKLPPRAPTTFLKPAWRKLVGSGATLDRLAYEVAAMMTLRDRLRSGDVWVEGSRAFRAFDDFLLPPETFVARRRQNDLVCVGKSAYRQLSGRGISSEV
jgi:hypothetical protein